MKTVSVNVNELQYEFRNKHMSSDAIVCDADGNITEARYYSPRKVYAGLYDKYGDMELPDMDYYSGLQDEADIKSAIDELSPCRHHTVSSKIPDNIHSYDNILHWYPWGYGLVFNARWACYPFCNHFDTDWHQFRCLGSAEFQGWASLDETYVQVFYNNYPKERGCRTILNCDGTVLAYMTWHWIDEE